MTTEGLAPLELPGVVPGAFRVGPKTAISADGHRSHC